MSPVRPVKETDTPPLPPEDHQPTVRRPSSPTSCLRFCWSALRLQPPCSEPFPVRNRSKRKCWSGRGSTGDRKGQTLGREREVHAPPTRVTQKSKGKVAVVTRERDRHANNVGCVPTTIAGGGHDECWERSTLEYRVIVVLLSLASSFGIVSPDIPKMPFQIPNSRSSGRGCVTQDQPDNGSTRPTESEKKHTLSICQTHTHATQCQQAGKKHRQRGGSAARNNHTHTGRRPLTARHTHTLHMAKVQKNESAQTRRDGSWVVCRPRPDGRRTRVSSFVCDMRVCGPCFPSPWGWDLGSGIVFDERLLGKNQMGILSQNAGSGGK